MDNELNADDLAWLEEQANPSVNWIEVLRALTGGGDVEPGT